MHIRWKIAAAMGSALPDPAQGMAAASPLPVPSVANKPAPGRRGPIGMQPRQTFSRVNTGAPPIADAGASAQKGAPTDPMRMLPMKVASEDPMGQMTSRMTIQEMLKAAAAGAATQQGVTDEAILQLANQGEHTPEEEKTASADPDAPEAVSTAYAEKLAAAVDYILKESDDPSGASPVESGSGTKQGPGDGPNALTVMEASASDPPIEAGSQGTATAAHIPPKNPATQPEQVQSGKANTGLETNDDMSHPEQPTEPISNEKGPIKAAAALLQEKGFTPDFLRAMAKEGKAGIGERITGALRTYKSNVTGEKVRNLQKTMKDHDVPSKTRQGQEESLEVLKKARNKAVGATAGAGVLAAGGTAAALNKNGSVDERLVDAFIGQVKAAGEKVAEDAINPAQMSSGSIDVSEPPPGAAGAEEQVPAQPSDHSAQTSKMTASNDKAIDTTKRDAKADPKSDVNDVLTEPALTTSTDKTLQKTLSKGTETAKISSAEATKTAAVRALVTKLAMEADEKAKGKKSEKEKDSMGGSGYPAPQVGGAAGVQ